MWKATLDLENETSAIRKVLAGSLSGEENIESCIDGLDEVYEEGVSAYADKAKGFINKLYTSLHSEVEDMKVAVALENAYANVLKVYAYDGTNASTKLMGDYAKAFDLKSYDSIDHYYEAVSTLLKAVAAGQAHTVDTSKDMSSKADYTVVLLAALKENGVNIASYTGNGSTTAVPSEDTAVSIVKAYLGVEA